MRDFCVGGFVISKAGHDKDAVYVVTDIQGDILSLADGMTKTMANPKKKKTKHVMYTDTKLDCADGLTDEIIKLEVKKYCKTRAYA